MAESPNSLDMQKRERIRKRRHGGGERDKARAWANWNAKTLGTGVYL